MTYFIVFGKPRAFESYEFVFGGDNKSVENGHREPILKPIKYDDSVLHYFVRDGFAGMEYYTRAKGCESERDGIVFGVAIKTTLDFNLTDTISNILEPFWSDFASQLLDEGRKFRTPSIIDLLRNTQWSQDEVKVIHSTAKSFSFRSTRDKLLLLVSPEIDDIRLVEDSIKKFEDVYIADNPDIFKEQVNAIVLKEADYKIYQVLDGIIAPIVETPQSQTKTQTSVFRNIVNIPKWGERRNQSNSTNIANNASEEDVHIPQNGKPDSSIWDLNLLFWGLVIVAIVFAFILTAVFLWPDSSENQTNDGQVTQDTTTLGQEKSSNATEAFVLKKGDTVRLDATSVQLASYDSPINNRLSLSPRIMPNTSSNIRSDIEFKVSDESLVDIDKEKFELVVKNHPKEETEVTVMAYICNALLGQQTYKIAKAKSQTVGGNVGISQPAGGSVRVSRPAGEKKLPDFNGSPRTLEQYLNDLEKDLTTKPAFVRDECQKIINGDYGNEFKNNNKAIKLRERAKQKIGDAELNF